MLELLVEFEVEAKIEHLLSPRPSGRVRLAHPAFFIFAFSHFCEFLVNIMPWWAVEISAKLMYFWLVSRCECPRALAMAAQFTPAFASSVANVWRIVCGFRCLLLQ